LCPSHNRTRDDFAWGVTRRSSNRVDIWCGENDDFPEKLGDRFCDCRHLAIMVSCLGCERMLVD
jgi:hypothetical protein